MTDVDVNGNVQQIVHTMEGFGFPPPKGGPLQQLLNRACVLLDDVDEMLVALDPEQDADRFACASALRRELKIIQYPTNVVRGLNSIVACRALSCRG